MQTHVLLVMFEPTVKILKTYIRYGVHSDESRLHHCGIPAKMFFGPHLSHKQGSKLVQKGMRQ